MVAITYRRSESLQELPPSSRDALNFHRKLPGYRQTPLHNSPEIAERLGLREVWVKDESSRFGLPAFKMLGASWATYKALMDLLGHPEWENFDAFKALCANLRPLTLVTATDGNHGRAVARIAALLGLNAHIFIPDGSAQARIDAIREEGAEVTVVPGSYDDAVMLSAEQADDEHLVISDTSWPGYETIPRDIVAGYATIFHEIDDALAANEATWPDFVFVQVGVGALASAVISHYRQQGRPSTPCIIGTEPVQAACLTAAMQANRVVQLPGIQDSIMAGLNCGTVSLTAWPLLRGGIDACITVEDEHAREAMRIYARSGLVAGETGAAGLAGLLALADMQDSAEQGQRLGLNENSSILLLITEGATDPTTYHMITAGFRT